MNSVLLLTNTTLDEPGGRSEKFRTREAFLSDRGYRLVTGPIREPYIPRLLPTILGCVRVARREEVDVINSISNPFHIHLIGYAVSRLTGIPWLAELRDPIGRTNPDRGEGFERRLAEAVEWLVATRADRVVWMDGIQLPDKYLQQRYNAPAERFEILPFIGFQRNHFEEASTAEYDKFTVTYAGSFYDGWIEPYAFLDGVEAFVRDGGTVRVQFYGDWSESYQRALEERGLSDTVFTHEFVPHEEIVPVLKGSDAVVHIGGDDPANELSVPSKIWDYIGARTPMLVVVDPTFRVAEVVRENGLGIVAPPDDPDAIADALQALASDDFEYAPGDAVFERFTRERHLQAYCDVLDSLVADADVP